MPMKKAGFPLRRNTRSRRWRRPNRRNSSPPSRAPPAEAGVDGHPRRLRPGTFGYPGKEKFVEYLGFPNPREWQPHDADWKLPADWKEIILDGIQERLEKYRSFRLFMDICVRCGACADKCHFYIGSGDPEEHAGAARRADPLGLPAVLHRGGQDLRRAGRRPRPDRGGAQGVVLLLLPVHRVPPLLRLLPLRHRHRRDHDDRPRAAEPDRRATSTGSSSPPRTASASATTSASSRTPSRTASSSLVDDLEELTGIRIEPPINRKGAEVLFVIPSADYFARRIFTLHGLPDALHRLGLDYTLSALSLRGRQLRPVHVARDDEAAQRQDLRRGEAPRREVDPRRRVRPHVARCSTSTWTR